MRITLSETTYDVNTKELSVVARVAANIEEFSDDKGYGRDSFKDQVISKVAAAIAQKVIDQSEAEIIKGVDIDAIIKRIQLYTVQQFTQAR